MKTTAAILVETAKPLELWDIDIPPLRSGQVLVEVVYSGACRTQVMEAWGMKGEDKWLPHCLGHEGTGTVLECGSAVTRVKAGDKVVLSWIRGGTISASSGTPRPTSTSFDSSKSLSTRTPRRSAAEVPCSADARVTIRRGAYPER